MSALALALVQPHAERCLTYVTVMDMTSHHLEDVDMEELISEQPDVEITDDVPSNAAKQQKKPFSFLEWAGMKKPAAGDKRTTSVRSPDKAATGGKADAKKVPMRGEAIRWLWCNLTQAGYVMQSTRDCVLSNACDVCRGFLKRQEAPTSQGGTCCCCCQWW